MSSVRRETSSQGLDDTFILRELRDAARGRRAVGEAFARRREAAMRLANGQIRFVVASRPDHPGEAPARQGSEEGRKSHEGHASDGQTRHRATEAGVRAVTSFGWEAMRG